MKIILDLGDQPLANSLGEIPNYEHVFYPLAITRCAVCGTVQLTNTVDPKLLFEKYVWVTGTSKVAKIYSKEFKDKALAKSSNSKKFVIEIASNDGTFLKPFEESGHKTLGIDPAKNIAEEAQKNGINTICDFFSNELAKGIVRTYGECDIIFARNVIPHVANAKDVIRGMSTCLKSDGIGIIEFHSADKIVSELHYDSIYHEHLFYHSIKSIEYLLNEFEMHLFDISDSPISGGSHVIYFSKEKKKISSNLIKYIEDEKTSGVNELESWRNFATQTKQHCEILSDLVKNYKRSGKKIVGYGASARSSTLLNYCRINNKYLDYIADKAHLKKGKYTPGTNILIEDPKTVMNTNPDIILLLAWNFKDEIIDEIRRLYNWKGLIILPLPNKVSTMEIK